MKKVLSIVAVVAVLACLGSCKKTCNCTTTVMGLSTTSQVETTKSCSSLNTKTTTNGITTEVTCK